MGGYAATFALVGGTFAVVDCTMESFRGTALFLPTISTCDTLAREVEVVSGSVAARAADM